MRDSGDALLEFMEFAIQCRTANGLPTSAFVGTPAQENADMGTQKSSRQEGREEDPAKKAAHRP